MIPITKPSIGKEEIAVIADVIDSGWITQGPKVKEFEETFASYVGAKYACAVSSCTTALHLSLLTVGVKPGDIVITVSHSYIATANSVRHCFAEPVFIDIKKNTYNIDPLLLESFFEKDCDYSGDILMYKHAKKLKTEKSPLYYIDDKKIGRIAAIMPVHQMGMPCEIDKITEIAGKHNIPVVEDAACAIGSEVRVNGKMEKIGKPHGDIACFSFHPRKIATTGDGGMITTNNAEYNSNLRLLRQHGMSVSDTVRHKSSKVIIEKYLETGYNYRMTDIQGAIGIEQIKKLPDMLTRRRDIDELYRKHLQSISWLRLPYVSKDVKSNWQSYPVFIKEDSPLSRDELMQYLLDNGVSTRPGIMNSHSEVPYNCFDDTLSVSDESRNNVILLPIYLELNDDDVCNICKLISDLK